MGRFSTLQNNATAGELSPRLTRTDLQKYSNGWHLVRNAYPIPQGAQTRRPGTRYLIDTHFRGAKKSRLIPFVASDSSVYGLEFTENLVRVLDKDDAVLTTVVTTYTEAELPDISFAQSADVLYLAHGSHPPATLSHFGPTSWTLADLEFDDGPYLPENTNKNWKLTAASTTGTAVNLTASGSGFAPFTASDVGKPVRLRHGTTTITWGWGTIVTYTSTTVVKVDIDPNLNFGAATATDKWRLGAWGSALGWPSIVSFQENRICFAASANEPINIWASQSNGYSPDTVLYGPTKSDGTITAAESITIVLAQKDIQRILWLSPGPSLAVGTVSAEWLVEAASATEAWSPTNSKATVQTTRGSKPGCSGIRIETSVLFVQQKGKKMREFTFNFTKNASQANDLMLMADHIALDSPIAEVVYVQDPHSYIVARLENGELRFLTYVGDEDVGGWSRQIIGGSYDGGNAVVESIMVLPDYDLGYDALWLVVKRTIDGETVRTIEIMQPPFYGGDIADAWYLDCATLTTGTDLNQGDALGLENETISIYVDGVTYPDVEVDLETIGLPSNVLASKVLAGYKYNSALTSIPMDVSTQGATRTGTALGKKKKVAAADLHIYETGRGVFLGVGAVNKLPDHMDPIETLLLDNATDAPAALFSGWMHKTLGGTYDDEPVLYFEVEDPIPFTLLEYVQRGDVTEN